MIDMHCHIIPSIDDGSKNILETIKMAKQAEEHGFSGVFATSHFIQDAHETEKNDIFSKVEGLNYTLKNEGCNLKIYTGNEVYFSSDILDLLKEEKVCTLNNSRYFLMEFPMSGLVLNMEQIIKQVINNGYIPIIAHPERYEFVSKDIKKLLPLIEEGALLQINYGSIAGVYGSTVKKNVTKLIKNNMVHLVGTDAHDSYKIYDVYDKSIKKLQKLMDENKLDKILNENPEHILNDEMIYTWSPKIK